ncbi:MAG TPA: methylated-DNA--[protein]-cysteine S-methyltransferase [Nitrospirota bacterium]
MMIFKTGLGWTGFVASDKGICRIVLPRKDKKAVERELRSAECGDRGAEVKKSSNPVVLKKAAKLLRKYFSGESVSFDLLLDLSYYTDFQRLVWKAARGIPYGETRSYAWIAERIGKPNAARAVGNALGANPVPILTP